MSKEWKSTLIETELHQAIKQYCVENGLPLIDTINNWLKEIIQIKTGGVKQ